MEMRKRVVNQGALSAECWMVQVFGVEYCKGCEYLHTEECGGQDILEKGENDKGIKIPIGEEVD
jgi:hypothetical protein